MATAKTSSTNTLSTVYKVPNRLRPNHSAPATLKVEQRGSDNFCGGARPMTPKDILREKSDVHLRKIKD
jgi:hypothetical protein